MFQGRFKAKIIDKDNYSLQLCRYIHLNPVKAKLSAHPGGYPWSSYAAFMGSVKKPAYLETGWLLSQIGNRAKFEAFTMRGLNDNWDPLESRATDVVLGSEEFIEKMKGLVSQKPKDSNLSGLRTLQKDTRIKQVESFVAKQSLNDKAKHKLRMYGLRCYTGLSLAEVGRRVGGVAPIAVCQAVRRFKAEAATNKALSACLSKLDRECQL